MRVMVDIDEKEYGLLCKPSEVQPLFQALERIYGLIWCEACYDPYSKDTETLARKMLADIQFANEILQFKK